MKTGDPWNGRSLEWATAFAAARIQFRGASQRARRGALLGHQAARHRDAAACRQSRTTSRSRCQGTARPVSSPLSSATITGFALIWHIWWMVAYRAVRCLRGICVVRVARRRGIRHPGARRSRVSIVRAGERASEWLQRSTTSSGARHERDGDTCRARALPDRSVQARVAAEVSWPRSGRHGRDMRPVTAKAARLPSASSSAYGFWIFLLSDIVMFSAFFAAHAVLQTATAGGPSGRDLFNPASIAIETACLLLSSFTCGMSAVAASARSQLWTQVWLLITGLLGLAFLGVGGTGFRGDGCRRRRAAAQRVPVLVLHCGRLHGLHVSAGLAVAGHDDGASFRQRFSRRHSAPAGLLQSVLARARYHLGRAVHDRLSDRTRPMSDEDDRNAG